MSDLTPNFFQDQPSVSDTASLSMILTLSPATQNPAVELAAEGRYSLFMENVCFLLRQSFIHFRLQKSAKMILATVFIVFGYLFLVPSLFWTFLYKWFTSFDDDVKMVMTKYASQEQTQNMPAKNRHNTATYDCKQQLATEYESQVYQEFVYHTYLHRNNMSYTSSLSHKFKLHCTSTKTNKKGVVLNTVNLNSCR